MTAKHSRLANRVMLSTIASGALAGTLAATCAVLALDRLAAHHADRRLIGAADVLAGELDEEREEGEWEPLGDIVADENGELVTSGIRLAVFSGAHRIAGDPWVPLAAAGRCALHGRVGSRARACGRGYHDWLLVAAAENDAATLPWFYLAAAIAALLAGTLVGALASLKLSGWALRPLTDLNHAIRRMSPGDTGLSLEQRSHCEEVELIREALLDLTRRMQGLLGQSQRFAAHAAHELRTPLTTIRGELDLLAEDAPSEAERARLVRVAEHARRLGELLERLLVLASPLEQAKLRFEPVSLSELAADVVDQLPAGDRERVLLQREGAEGLVAGEATLLRAMVENAIDNALKFSGRLPIDVRLSDDTAANGEATPWVRIEVSDRGPGVPRELSARVFEPFYRATADATPGHGLGLALIEHVARVHGGRAELLPTEAGAVLRISLPAWRQRAVQEHRASGKAAREA